MQDTIKGRGLRRSRLGLGIVAAVTLSCLGLSACGSGSSGDGSKTLVIQVQSAQLPAFQYAASKFEDSHEGVKVDLQTITEEQKSSTNAQIMASTNAPDIGLVPTNAQPYLDLLKADALLPLDDVWEDADLDTRYEASMATSLKSNDTPYVVLFDTTLYNVVFYNKDAFRKAGIPEPADHQIRSNDELYDVIGKLKSAGFDGLAMGGNAGYQWGWLVDGQLQANASGKALEDFKNSWKSDHTQTTPYTSTEFTDSVKQFKDWADKGVFQEGVLGQDGDQAQAAFTAGKSGMFLGGTWIPSILEKASLPFDYGWLLLPGKTSDKPTVPIAYAGDTLAVPRTAKNPDLAKDFLELYVSDEVQKYAAENVGSLPSVQTVKAADIPALGEVVQEIVTFSSGKGTTTGWTSILPGSLGQSFIDPEIQKYLGGQVSLDEVGQNQQRQFENFKAKNG